MNRHRPLATIAALALAAAGATGCSNSQGILITTRFDPDEGWTEPVEVTLDLGDDEQRAFFHDLGAIELGKNVLANRQALHGALADVEFERRIERIEEISARVSSNPDLVAASGRALMLLRAECADLLGVEGADIGARPAYQGWLFVSSPIDKDLRPHRALTLR